MLTSINNAARAQFKLQQVIDDVCLQDTWQSNTLEREKKKKKITPPQQDTFWINAHARVQYQEF